ncbi:hypothetical protein ENBRE01_2086 [Enteropsectra breve]|nr:hypothetical protein ENBRE01_2086 [Enteropsectra breve]
MNTSQWGNMDEVHLTFDMPKTKCVHAIGAKEVPVKTTGHEKSDLRLH